MPSDFTIIRSRKLHFGDEENYLKDVEPDKDFTGDNLAMLFDCPGVDTSQRACLMFQSRDVDTQKNVFKVNGSNIDGGTPDSPSKDTWNGNIMIIEGRLLRATSNILRVVARNDDGGEGGDIDDFILDNIVVMYKTRSTPITNPTVGV
jgi:hypothetical protein